MSHRRSSFALGLAVAVVSLVAYVGADTGSSATTTATAGKWCSGVKIAAFPGGPQGGVFANNVYNGFKQAQADLGPSVTYYFSDWSAEKLVQQMRLALALKPDGLASYGFAGEAATGPLVKQAYKQGTIFTVLNTELPVSTPPYASRGMGYVGAPNYTAGASLAAEAIKRGRLKRGDKAFVWGLASLPSRGERTKGVVQTLKKAGLKVVYQEIDDATNKDPQAGTPTFVGVLSRDKDIKLVVTDHGGMTATAEAYMKAAGRKPGSLYFAGFDLSPATATAVKSGYLNLVIDQQPYLQGYLPILQICLTKKYGFSGLFVNTAGAFIDKSNVAVVAPLAAKEIR